MDSPDLCFQSAVSQKKMLDAGDISVLELVDAHIARIEMYNASLNAFVTLCLDEARDAAKRADGERASGTALGALHGLPIGVKDCFPTEGLRTTMACVALKDWVPDFDHLVVEREKQAGAIILGKLNTPEFTMAMNTCGNDVFGATRNPWNLELCPGASSGGSGAALAAGLCSLADGSDIGGSVRNPAAWCGIVGHRPTTWLIPDVPNPRLWHNMNTAGPMARTVQDAALFLSILAGPDRRCPVQLPAPFPPGVPALRESLEQVRIGWSEHLGSVRVAADIADNFQRQRDVFESLGALVTPFEIDIEHLGESYDVLVYQRVAADVASIYETQRDELSEQLCERYRWFMSLSSEDVARAERYRHTLWAEVVAAFEDHDVLVWPNNPSDPYGFEDEETAQGHDWRLLYVAPLLNLPAVTVPCGFSEAGVPRGLQITGRPGADLEVLNVAYAFEQATRYGSRRPLLG